MTHHKERPGLCELIARQEAKGIDAALQKEPAKFGYDELNWTAQKLNAHFFDRMDLIETGRVSIRMTYTEVFHMIYETNPQEALSMIGFPKDLRIHGVLITQRTENE